MKALMAFTTTGLFAVLPSRMLLNAAVTAKEMPKGVPNPILKTLPDYRDCAPLETLNFKL
jgi:hypothetical protein